jgi:hypothetical protein
MTATAKRMNGRKPLKTILWSALVMAGLTVLSACGGEDPTLSLEAVAEPSIENLAQMSNGLTVDETNNQVLTYHGGSGGTAYTIDCAPGSVAVGIHGWAGQYIDRLGLVCRSLGVDGSLGDSYTTFAVGGSGGGYFRVECPVGQAIVAIGGANGWYVDRVELGCATPAGWMNPYGVKTYPPPVGGTGGTYFFDNCYHGSVLTGFNLRTGYFVDGVQGHCSKLN